MKSVLLFSILISFAQMSLAECPTLYVEAPVQPGVFAQKDIDRIMPTYYTGAHPDLSKYDVSGTNVNKAIRFISVRVSTPAMKEMDSDEFKACAREAAEKVFEERLPGFVTVGQTYSTISNEERRENLLDCRYGRYPENFSLRAGGTVVAKICHREIFKVWSIADEIEESEAKTDFDQKNKRFYHKFSFHIRLTVTEARITNLVRAVIENNELSRFEVLDPKDFILKSMED